MKTKERQTDIQRSILVPFSGLMNEKPRIANGFIVRICIDIGTDFFYFKQVVTFKDVSNVFRNDFFIQLFNDKQVDTVTIFAENIFRLKLQQMRILLQVDLHGAGCRFMPVGIMFFMRYCFC